MTSLTKFHGLALIAAVMSAAVGTGCSKQKVPEGAARIGVTINAATAVNLDQITLTVSDNGNAPTFTPIVADLTNNDLSKKLAWSGYVQGIPAGTLRKFDVVAKQLGVTVFSGSAFADVAAGGTTAVSLILQGPNDGGFSNYLPIVDSLSSSASTVVVGTTPPPAAVALTFTAHDPDVGSSMTFQWTSDCVGTSFSSASGTVAAGANATSWSPPASVPASGACTLTLKVTDNVGGSVTAVLGVQIKLGTDGSAIVAAYPNSWPMISGLTVNETFTQNLAGQIVAVDYDLNVAASDSDGDELNYAWSVSGCSAVAAGEGFTATVPSVTTPSATLAYGFGQIASSAVHFHTADLTHACVIKVDVTDRWPNGLPPAGSGLPVLRGGDTVGLINGSLPQAFVVGPRITAFSAPNAPKNATPNSATYVVQGGQTLTLDVETLDPTPVFNPAQTPFTFTWTQSGGSFAAVQPADATGSPGKSTHVWTAAATYAPGTFVAVTVTNKAGLTTSYTWNLSPANPCDKTAASVGLSCDTGGGLCAPGGVCDITGACVSPTPVVCAAPAQCQAAGVCNPSTGLCSYANVTAGTSCNADSNGCTFNDACDASGTCVAGAAPVSPPPADAQCQSATGVCVSTGNNSYSFAFTSVADGTSCNKDNNGCTTDTCQAGACTVGAAVDCTQTANTCLAAVGTCTSTGPSSHTCSNAPMAAGTACNDGNACTTGDACNGGGACVGVALCPNSQSCNPVGPVCIATAVAPQVARDLLVSPPAGIAMDTSGSTYVVSAISSLTPVNFDGFPVTSTGDFDLFLAKYDTTGKAVWALGVGDALANPQIGTGAAVTQDGTLAAIGTFSGTVTIGNVINSSASIDFLAGINSSTGAGKWAKQFNDGTNGLLKSVAANPSSTTNRIAVCGLAVQAATDLVTGAVYGGANDIIIGVFDSAGNKLWSKQVGSAGNEECDAVAVDDNGDVYAVGKFDSASLAFGGTTAALVGPGTTIRKFLWVAKFNGLTGAPIASVAYGNTVGTANPTSIVASSLGKVVIAGNFTSALPFGAITLTGAGGSDAFIAQLDPSVLSTNWAVRLGGAGSDTANGVALTSFGDVVVTGAFNRTTTGAAALTAASATAPDIFVLKLNGTTGATDDAKGYGDAVTQTGDAVVVNRFGGNQITVAGTLNGTIPFPAPAGSVAAAGAQDVFLMTGLLQ
jgi:hypothetical protein